MRFIILSSLCVVAHLQLMPAALAGTLSCYSAGPCPVLNPENGHYYAFSFSYLPGSAPTWDAAQLAAESFTHLGRQGHLATITSASEHAFLKSVVGTQSQLWMGASDRDVNGEWRWMVGPEAGELFWRGGPNGEAVGYSDWAPDEPDDASQFPQQVEQFGVMNSRYSGQGQWNDYWDCCEVGGFTVEFSPVPEPSTYALATIGLIGMAGVIRQRKRH